MNVFPSVWWVMSVTITIYVTCNPSAQTKISQSCFIKFPPFMLAVQHGLYYV